MTYERLESLLAEATGPSRELDHRCFAVLYGWDYPLLGASAQEYESIGSPSYSASIDAALTLVPEDSFWRVGNDGEGVDPALYRADVGYATWPNGKDAMPHLGFERRVAATPALALCLAAIRARRAGEVA